MSTFDFICIYLLIGAVLGGATLIARWPVMAGAMRAFAERSPESTRALVYVVGAAMGAALTLTECAILWPLRLARECRLALLAWQVVHERRIPRRLCRLAQANYWAARRDIALRHMLTRHGMRD